MRKLVSSGGGVQLVPGNRVRKARCLPTQDLYGESVAAIQIHTCTEAHLVGSCCSQQEFTYAVLWSLPQMQIRQVSSVRMPTPQHSHWS